MKFRTPNIWKHYRHHIKWALIHSALVLFFADLLSTVWPAFASVWERKAHIAIALAAFLATLAEYIYDDDKQADLKKDTDHDN